MHSMDGLDRAAHLLGPAEDSVVLGVLAHLRPALETYLGTIQGKLGAHGLSRAPTNMGLAAAHHPRGRPHGKWLLFWLPGVAPLSLQGPACPMGASPFLGQRRMLPSCGQSSRVQRSPDQSLGLGPKPCSLFHSQYELGQSFSPPARQLPHLYKRHLDWTRASYTLNESHRGLVEEQAQIQWVWAEA